MFLDGFVWAMLPREAYENSPGMRDSTASQGTAQVVTDCIMWIREYGLCRQYVYCRVLVCVFTV